MQSITSIAENQTTAKPATPYESIDPEVRRLVRLINERPGLHTEWSCAGHALGEEAYVSFTADSQDAVAALLGAMPFVGWNAGFAENRPIAKVIWMTLGRADEGRLRYDLRLGGYPEFARKELICEVEHALAQSSTR